MDISDLPTDALLASIAEHERNPRNTAEMWLKAAKIVAGETRTQSADLYAKYLEFMANTLPDEKPMDLAVWGKYMTWKFRKTRLKNGYCYHISKERDPETGRDVKKGGGGTLGG